MRLRELHPGEISAASGDFSIYDVAGCVQRGLAAAKAGGISENVVV